MSFLQETSGKSSVVLPCKERTFCSRKKKQSVIVGFCIETNIDIQIILNNNYKVDLFVCKLSHNLLLVPAKDKHVIPRMCPVNMHNKGRVSSGVPPAGVGVALRTRPRRRRRGGCCSGRAGFILMLRKDGYREEAVTTSCGVRHRAVTYGYARSATRY